jgi:hypothetical protein
MICEENGFPISRAGMLYNWDSLLAEAGNKLVGQYWRREDCIIREYGI